MQLKLVKQFKINDVLVSFFIYFLAARSIINIQQGRRRELSVKTFAQFSRNCIFIDVTKHRILANNQREDIKIIHSPKSFSLNPEPSLINI